MSGADGNADTNWVVLKRGQIAPNDLLVFFIQLVKKVQTVLSSNDLGQVTVLRTLQSFSVIVIMLSFVFLCLRQHSGATGIIFSSGLWVCLCVRPCFLNVVDSVLNSIGDTFSPIILGQG